MHYIDKIIKNYFVILLISVMFFLVYIGAKTTPKRSNIKEEVFKEDSLNNQETEPIVIDTVVETTTTSTTVVEIEVVETTVVKTITTIQAPKKIITTAPPKSYDSSGPPHNTTSLVGCIAYYESSWGKDPNVFQFTQGTWEAYGGSGSPSNASYAEQEAIFWAAWNDDGEHHWAAQKGRCF